LHLTITSMLQAQSDQDCNIFNFAVLDFLQGFLFTLFHFLFQPQIPFQNSILFSLSILSPHHRCLCRVEAVKSRPVHSIRGVLFSILKDRSALHYCCACSILLLSSAVYPRLVPIFQLEYCKITLRLCLLLFKFVF
jgi:hypothetical protein